MEVNGVKFTELCNRIAVECSVPDKILGGKPVNLSAAIPKGPINQVGLPFRDSRKSQWCLKINKEKVVLQMVV